MTADTQAETKPKSNRNIFQEYSEAFVVAVVLAIIIRALFVQAFKIPSSSMEPTLLVGDHILVTSFFMAFAFLLPTSDGLKIVQPRRGDVIVFVFPEDRTKDFIKRVVAIVGDTIEIRNKKVILNGQEVTNPRAHFYSNVVMPGDMNPRDNMNQVTVPQAHLFVMGDNRDYSHDSRFLGLCPFRRCQRGSVPDLLFGPCRWMAPPIQCNSLSFLPEIITFPVPLSDASTLAPGGELKHVRSFWN